MKQTQQDRKAMFEATLAYLNDNQSAWADNKAFTAAVADLKTALAGIDEKSTRQHGVTTSATADRDQSRDDLEESIFVIASQLSAMAQAEHAPGLAAEVEITRSALDKLSAEDLDKTAQRIHEHATNYLAQLADYNVTADDVTQLGGRRVNFGTAKTTPRGAIAGRAAATASLPQAMNDASQILRGRIDKLMTTFRQKNPNFLAGYNATRVVVDHVGRGHPTAPAGTKPAPA